MKLIHCFQWKVETIVFIILSGVLKSYYVIKVFPEVKLSLYLQAAKLHETTSGLAAFGYFLCPQEASKELISSQ